MSSPTPLRPDQRSLHGRIERQLGSLLVLARRWPQYDADLDRAFQALTQSCAVALEVDRAGIWMLDGDAAIVCRDLYEAGRHRHSRGYRFTRDAAPAYFSALQTEGWIQAVDAHSDPRTAAFAGSYLVPHGIGALMDVPIRVGGRVGGVLRVEHTGGPRTFQNDEVGAAAFVANLAALAVEAQRARVAESRLGDERTLLGAVLDASGAAVIVLDRAGNVRYHNDRLLEMWGLGVELMGPAGGNGIRIERIAAQTVEPARFIARFRRISADDAGPSQDTVTTTDGRVIERASVPLTLADGSIARAWSFRLVSAASASD